MKYLVALVALLACSTPSPPHHPSPPAEAAPPDVLETGAEVLGDEAYEGLAPPACAGPGAGCGDLWCWPTCGVPGQPGGTGAGGALPQ